MPIKWGAWTVDLVHNVFAAVKITMAPNLAPGLFKIVSLINEHPAIGVNHTRPAAQRVRVGGPVTTV